MTDHTPSPQSVVVPMFDDTKIEALSGKYGEINCTYDDGVGHISDLSAFCEEVAGLPNTTKSRVASGFYRVIERLGGMSDTLSIAGSYGDTLTDEQVADELEAWLAAAPAPSSLAGGEVERAARALLDACIADFGDPADYPDDDGWVASGDNGDSAVTFKHLRDLQAALSPEAPAREGGDLEGLLTTALTDELQDGGAEVPYSIIAERVAARVADEASAPSCALTTAAKEVLSFLQNAPLESGICCCGDPISGHGYGSGHSPVDDLAYHSSQVAKKLQDALTPRHEAPASRGLKPGDQIEFRAHPTEPGREVAPTPHHEAPASEGVDVRAIALAAMNEMRRSGESYEMCARWISERVNSARSSAPEAREGEAVDHRPECWGSTSYSGEMAHCYCSQSTAAPSADKLRIAVEALEWIEVNAAKTDCMTVTHKAIQALAALKAEV